MAHRCMDTHRADVFVGIRSYSRDSPQALALSMVPRGYFEQNTRLGTSTPILGSERNDYMGPVVRHSRKRLE